MRKNNVCFGYCHGILHSLPRNMGNIDKHSQSVHLTNDSLAKHRKPTMPRLVSRRISPAHTLGMGQRHITRAQSIELPEHCKRIVNRMPTFDANERGNFSTTMNALDISRTIGHLEGCRISICHLMKYIDLFDDLLYMLRLAAILANRHIN